MVADGGDVLEDNLHVAPADLFQDRPQFGAGLGGPPAVFGEDGGVGLVGIDVIAAEFCGAALGDDPAGEIERLKKIEAWCKLNHDYIDPSYPGKEDELKALLNETPEKPT